MDILVYALCGLALVLGVAFTRSMKRGLDFILEDPYGNRNKAE